MSMINLYNRGIIMEKFSDRIIQLKKEHKLRQKQAAEGIGMSVRGYQYLESGEKEPTTATLIAIATLYNVSLDYLVGRMDNPEMNR